MNFRFEISGFKTPSCGGHRPPPELWIRERLLKGFVAATPVAPFASITWIRFNGSPAHRRRTLSLYLALARKSGVGRLPEN